MNFLNTNIFFVLLIFIHLRSVTPRKDFLKWFKAFRMIKVEILSGRTLGIHKDAPNNFGIITDGIKYNIDPTILVDGVNHGPRDADLIYGKGLTLKGNPFNPITFSVDLPTSKKQSNICGLTITSLNDYGNEFIFNLRLLWKSDTNMGWDLLANPSNGDQEFYLRMRPNSNTRVVIFDSVPALHFQLMLTTIPNKNVNFKLAFLDKCRYPKTYEIVNCGEKVDQNPRFKSLPFEVPISIKCPIDCIREWPCWGFKVYSSDSPICWTAAQNFGRWGDGTYTMYRIPIAADFKSEVRPQLNHGIFCRKSIIQYEAFTFDRKFYDFTKIEYRDLMGAKKR